MNEEDLNKKWEIHKVVDEAVRGALNYDESSKQSAIDIATLRTNQINIVETLKTNQESNEKAHDAIMKSLIDFHVSNKESMKEMSDKLDKALDKKADKWIEKVFIWLGIGIGGGLLAYLGNLIIKLIKL
jgi:hypothetical protein